MRIAALCRVFLPVLLMVCAPFRVGAAAALLVSWGWDDFGQVKDAPAGSFLAVAAGGYHSVALKSGGTLVSWGRDNWGQVRGTPAGRFVAVAAGHGHSVAIKSDGTLVAWGWDQYGQVSGLPAGTFTAVDAGFSHSVGIRSDATLVSWGAGLQAKNSPTGTFTATAAGLSHSVALRSDRTLVSWGQDESGQVSGTPAGTFLAVSAGDYHSVAIKSDGTLVSWGMDRVGQVSGTPSGTFVAVAAGAFHSVAIRSDGTLVSWGRDNNGQVRGTPPGKFSMVAAGLDHSLAAVLTEAVELNEAAPSRVAKAPDQVVTQIASFIDRAKLAISPEGGARPRVQRVLQLLATARNSGQAPSKMLDQAIALAGYSGAAAELTKQALLRSLEMAEKFGCLNEKGLDEMKRGNAATIIQGPCKGETLCVDHIIPRTVTAELDNVIANLELRPFSIHSTIPVTTTTIRQRATAKKLYRAGLLSKAGLESVLRN